METNTLLLMGSCFLIGAAFLMDLALVVISEVLANKVLELK